MRVRVFKGGEVVGPLRPFAWVGGESVVWGEPGRVPGRLFVLGCIRGHPESAEKGDVDLLDGPQVLSRLLIAISVHEKE